MPQIFQHPEKKHRLHMDGRIRDGFTTAEILLNFRTAAFKTTGWRDTIPLPGSIRAFRKRGSRTEDDEQ